MKILRVVACSIVLALLLASAAAAEDKGQPKNETHQNQDGSWTQTSTYPDGSKTVTEMDKDLHKTKETNYDAKGNKIEESDWAWNDKIKMKGAAKPGVDVMQKRHIFHHGNICESVTEYDENGVKLKNTVTCEGYVLVDTYKAGKVIKREKIVNGKVVKIEHFDDDGKLVKTERFDKDGKPIQPTIAQPPQPNVITPGSQESGATAQLVGLVYDKDSRPGDQVTVSLTTDPKKYEGIPALGVIEMEVPVAAAAEKGSLQGVVVDLGDGRQQPADQPLTIKLWQSAASVPVAILRPGNDTPAAQGALPLAQGPFPAPVSDTGNASDFLTPPVVQNVSFIRGPLSGDGNMTQVTVDNQPATIVAGTPRSLFFNLPPGLAAGAHTLTMQDGQRTASASIVKMGLIMKADQLKLQRGQSTNYSATVVLGPLPESAWQHGGASPELVNQSEVNKLAPSFHPPQAGEPAVVLFHLENGSRQTITIKPSQNEAITRVLRQQDFSNGQFTEAGVVQSKQSGGFDINAIVQAFFAPISLHEVLASGTSKVNCGGGCGTERSTDEDGTKWVWCSDHGCENTAGCECHVMRNWEDPPGSGKWKHEDLGKHGRKNKQKEDGTSTYTASCEPS